MKDISKSNAAISNTDQRAVPAELASTKRPYSTPKLTEYGAISDLTHAGGSTGSRDLVSRTMM